MIIIYCFEKRNLHTNSKWWLFRLFLRGFSYGFVSLKKTSPISSGCHPPYSHPFWHVEGVSAVAVFSPPPSPSSPPPPMRKSRPLAPALNSISIFKCHPTIFEGELGRGGGGGDGGGVLLVLLKGDSHGWPRSPPSTLLYFDPSRVWICSASSTLPLPPSPPRSSTSDFLSGWKVRIGAMSGTKNGHLVGHLVTSVFGSG